MRPEVGTTLSADQAVTVSAASTNETKVGANAGRGGSKKVVFTVKETFTAAGAATLTVALQCSTTSGSGYATVVSLPAKALADLTAGKQFTLTLPDTHSAYCQAYYTVATGPMTAGKLDAQFMLDVQNGIRQ